MRWMSVWTAALRFRLVTSFWSGRFQLCRLPAVRGLDDCQPAEPQFDHLENGGSAACGLMNGGP